MQVRGWGDTTTSNNMCVQTLVDFSSQIPRNWFITPPTLPTTVSTWNAQQDYPAHCVLVSGDINNNNGNWATNNPPGIYCSNNNMQIKGDFTSGAGYTFFALNGASISISSNGTKLKYYWPPSGCGPRPDPPAARPATVSCPGFTTATFNTGFTGRSCSVRCYDPRTLFYATSTDSVNAISHQGGNTGIDGDIFAPLRSGSPAFLRPPDPTQPPWAPVSLLRAGVTPQVTDSSRHGG